jgi:hypothetical protein
VGSWESSRYILCKDQARHLMDVPDAVGVAGIQVQKA